MTTDNPLAAARERLEAAHFPPATCYRTHTQPDEGNGVFGAVWLADVVRFLATSEAAAPAGYCYDCSHARGYHDEQGCTVARCSCQVFRAAAPEREVEGLDVERLRDAAQEYFEASLPLLNDYPLTDSERRDAWQRLRETNIALRQELGL